MSAPRAAGAIDVHTHISLGTDPYPPAGVDAYLEGAAGLAAWLEGQRDRLAPQTDVTLDEALGADRFLFGTGMPFKVPEVALLKLETVRDADARAAIVADNYTRLFG